MIIPNALLFYEIVQKYLGPNSSFLLRGINEVVNVKKGSEEEEFCKTLCVSDQGKIYINNEFWNTKIKTNNDAAFALLHELMHVALGDTVRKVDPHEADIFNITADIRINAMVYSIMKSTYTYGSLYQSRELDTLFTVKMYSDPDYRVLQHTELKKNNKFLDLHN